MSVKMRIERVKLITDEHDYTFDLSGQCTVLDGPVGTGKSSLLELIKHAFGGTAVLTPVTRKHVRSVEARVNLNGQLFMFTRGFGREARFVEMVDLHGDAAPRQIPVRTQSNETSISEFLLQALDLPSVKIPRARSNATSASVQLTFNDLYTYLYVEQQEIDRSIAHHTETFREPKRRAIFELLFGLSDAGQLRAETDLGRIRDELKDAQRRLDSVSNFLATAAVDDEITLRNRRADLDQQALDATASLAHLRNDLSQITNSHKTLRQRVYEAQVQADSAEAELQAARAEVTQRETLLAQLHVDLNREDKARSASRRLSPLEFISCPRCLQDIDESRGFANHCVLCLQPVRSDSHSDSDGDESYDQQIQETATLLVQSRHVAERCADWARIAEANLMQLRADLDGVTAEAIAPRFQEIEILSGERAHALSGIENVDQLLRFYTEADAIRGEVAELTTARLELEKFLDDAKSRLESKRSVLDELSTLFDETVKSLQVPWATSASLDSRTYLPLVNGEPFETLAVAGGTKTIVTVAYHLTLLAYALQQQDTLLPQILIIDTPRKNLGSNINDSEMGSKIYARMHILAQAYGDRVQFIIADNDAPADRSWINVISFDYDRPLIEHVLHPGEEAALSGELETVGSLK